ncbi:MULTISPECIES: SHOCT domain-containing protein [Clostridium]|uniref:SHOCT domain-containing protein n=1 Tax=Clostridium lapidicellarium TaxID=3240931 RepID=A0ABV4DT77_9CLOT
MLTVENNSVEYLVSKSILKELLKEKLITEDEFINIDIENRRSFNK